MEKKFFLIISLFVLILVLSACGSTTKKGNSATNGNSNSSRNDIHAGPDVSGAPQWVTKGISGLFCGIGVSKVTNQSEVALKIARKYAIYSIAGHLKTQINRYLEDFHTEYDGLIDELVNTSVSLSLSKGLWWTTKSDYVFLIRCIEPEEFEKIFTDWINENGMQRWENAKSEVYKNLENNTVKYLTD